MMFRNGRFLDLTAIPSYVAEGTCVECSLKEHLVKRNRSDYPWYRCILMPFASALVEIRGASLTSANAVTNT